MTCQDVWRVSVCIALTISLSNGFTAQLDPCCHVEKPVVYTKFIWLGEIPFKFPSRESDCLMVWDFTLVSITTGSLAAQYLPARPREDEPFESTARSAFPVTCLFGTPYIKTFVEKVSKLVLWAQSTTKDCIRADCRNRLALKPAVSISLYICYSMYEVPEIDLILPHNIKKLLLILFFYCLLQKP